MSPLRPDGPLVQMYVCPACGSVFPDHNCTVSDLPVQLALF